jgi:SAM-dependent methyltransferase
MPLVSKKPANRGRLRETGRTDADEFVGGYNCIVTLVPSNCPPCGAASHCGAMTGVRALVIRRRIARAYCALLLAIPFAGCSNATDSAIRAIQSEISAEDGPTGFYTTTYRPSETLFWRNLPVWMEQDAKEHQARKVLDIGCGYGTLLAFAAETYHAAPYCMDVIHYMPLFGRHRGFNFATGNIQLDPIPWQGAFDVIIMTEVLEHFNFQPLPTMRKIRDALAPNGVFFLSTPDAAEWGQRTRYYSRLEDLPPASTSAHFIDDHIWVYSKNELMQLASDSGFRVVRFAYSPGVGHRHFNMLLRKN